MQVQLKAQEKKVNVCVQPSAGVLVKVSAGKALVTASSFQNPPGFLSAADLYPSEI